MATFFIPKTFFSTLYNQVISDKNEILIEKCAIDDFASTSSDSRISPGQQNTGSTGGEEYAKKDREEDTHPPLFDGK